MNIHDDPLEVLGPAFTHALAAVLDTRQTDPETARRANNYLNDLQTNPRGVEVMLWLLKNLQSISVADPDYFLFAILNTLCRACNNAKTLPDHIRLEKRWLHCLTQLKTYIDGQLFGSSPDQLAVLNRIMQSQHICAKLQQIMGILYVPFRPSDWKNLSQFVVHELKAGGSDAALRSFVSGALLELCYNLSYDKVSSSASQKKIDKSSREERVRDMAGLIGLLEAETLAPEELSPMSIKAATQYCKLLVEFTALVLSVNQIVLLERPWPISLRPFASPKLATSIGTLAEAAGGFHRVVQVLITQKYRRDFVYAALSKECAARVVHEIIDVAKEMIDRCMSSTALWDDEDYVLILDNVISAVSMVVANANSLHYSWRTNPAIVYIILTSLHNPCQNSYVKAVSALSEVLRSRSGKLLPMSGSPFLTKEQVNAFFAMSFRLVIYRFIRVNAFKIAEDFVDQAMTALIQSGVRDQLGIKATGFADLTSWRALVLQATVTGAGVEDAEVKTLLSGQIASLRTSFKQLLESLSVDAWNIFQQVLMQVLRDWLSGEQFAANLTKTFPPIAGLKPKMQAFGSPCYALVDAAVTVIQLLGEEQNLSAKAAGEAALCALLQLRLSWIDAPSDLVKPENLGSHWHWVEWRRIEMVRTCPALCSKYRQDIVLPFLFKRITLEKPPWWTSSSQSVGLEEGAEVFRETRRVSCLALVPIVSLAPAPEVGEVIKLLVQKAQSHTVRENLRPLTDAIVALTSSLNSLPASREAVENIVSGSIAQSLESISSSPDALNAFLFEGDVAQCTDRRKELCRELISLEYITNSLVLPTTFGDCFSGGYCQPGLTAQMAPARTAFLAEFPLQSKAPNHYADLFVVFEAAQANYAMKLLPLLLQVLSRIAESYTSRCAPTACTCKYPMRCTAMNTFQEEDLSRLHGNSYPSKSMEEIWQEAGIPDPQDQRLLSRIQNNIKNLTTATAKLTSSLLKVCLGIALYNNQPIALEFLKLCLNTIREILPGWLAARGVSASFHLTVLDAILYQGLLWPFISNGLPTSTYDKPPVILDPHTLLLPTPDTVAFAMQVYDGFIAYTLPVILQLTRHRWLEACGAARQFGSSVLTTAAECRKAHALSLLSMTTQLLSVFVAETQAVSGKSGVDNDGSIGTGPGAMLQELSKCTTCSMRAILHVYLIREIYARSRQLSSLLSSQLELLSYPVSSTIAMTHRSLRTYARLAWRRMGPLWSAQSEDNFKKWIQDQILQIDRVVHSICGFALIVTAEPPIADDPFAAEYDVEPAIRTSFPNLPAPLLHHIYSGKSSSSACQVYAAVCLNKVEQTPEIIWQADDAANQYVLTVTTLFELYRAGVHLFGLKAARLTLKKSPGYQLNKAELLSCAQLDPDIQSLILALSNKQNFRFTLDSDALVVRILDAGNYLQAWMPILYEQKENKIILEDLRGWLIGNLNEVSILRPFADVLQIFIKNNFSSR